MQERPGDESRPLIPESNCHVWPDQVEQSDQNDDYAHDQDYDSHLITSPQS
jgi:hypothetical protein